MAPGGLYFNAEQVQVRSGAFRWEMIGGAHVERAGASEEGSRVWTSSHQKVPDSGSGGGLCPSDKGQQE